MRIGKQGETGAQDIASQLCLKFVRAGEVAQLVTNNRNHMEEDTGVTFLGCEDGV
jgi:hypothetical protein